MQIRSKALVAVLALTAMSPVGILAQEATTRRGGSAAGPATIPSTARVAHPRVVVISIDGCRPDVALRANMPVLRSLMARGAFTFWARTTDVAITLPSHTSMITGVTPARHTIDWNDDVGPDRFHYPAFPTLMEVAAGKGMTTALVAAKSKFVALAKPGTLTWSDIPDTGKIFDAAAIGQKAAAVISSHHPDVLMVHFGDADKVGHSIGWGSPQQVAALEQIDTALGTVIQAIAAAGEEKETLVIISTDHGGAGLKHGANDMRSAFIPWVVVGPGVRVGYDLTRNPMVTVHTEDTFATGAAFLQLETDPTVDGHSVNAIYQPGEMITGDGTTRPSRRRMAAQADTK